jgi:hypothetical protein
MSYGLRAQNFPVQATLAVNSPYSNQLSDYVTEFDKRITLVLTGNADVRLAGTLKSNTGVWITVPELLSYYRNNSIDIQPIQVRGSKRISAADIGNLFSSDPSRNTSSANLQHGIFGSNFTLPEGDYELCVKVFEVNGSTQLSQEACAYFTIQNIEPPYLTAPVDKDTLATPTAAYQPVQFQWTFPAGAQPNRIEYVLQIAELRAGQNPYNVFESGPPFAEIVLPNANPVYFLKASDPRLEIGQQYAWRVQVRGKGQYEGLTNFQNKGFSTVNTFTYGALKTTAADLVTSSEKVVGTTTQASSPTAVKGVFAYNPADAPTQCACKFPAVDKNAAQKNNLAIGDVVRIGGADGYQLTITKIEPGASGYDGSGTIALSPALMSTTRSSGLFIPLKVEFKGLVCTEAGLMMGGTVTSKKRDGSVIDYMPTTVDNTAMPNLESLNLAANSWAWVKTNITDVASAQFNGAGVETPLGIQDVGGLMTIALDNFVFTASSAQYDALTVLEDKSGFTPVVIPLGVKGQCMPNFSDCAKTTLYLVKDAPLGNTGLSLVGGPDLASATHATFALSGPNAGLKNLHIVAAYEISGAKAVNTDGSIGGVVKALLTADTKDGFGNWMAKDSVNTKFKMDGLDDFEFELTDATYDHDAGKNPDGLPAMVTELAKNVDSGKLQFLQTTDWMGFYMPKLSVTLPSVFQTEKNGHIARTAVEMTNVIIDNKHGLTGGLGVGSVSQPIIKFDDGSLDGWYFSLDNIGITFFDKSFVNAKARGRVGLPISGKDEKSALAYTSSLSPNKTTGKLSYNFNVEPTGKVSAEVWAATMSVNADSRLDITIGDPAVNAGKLMVKAKLNGGLAFAPTSKFSLDLLKINNLVIQSVSPYVVVDAATSDSFKQATGDAKSFFSGSFTESKQTASIDKKTSSTSQPPLPGGGSQATAAGFPLVIEEFKPVVEVRDGGTVRAGFYFYGGLKLTDIALAPKALVGLRVLANVQFNGKRPVWKGVDPELDKVAVSGQTGPVKIKGSLDFYRGTEMFGTGFRGYLKATIASVGVDVNAQFGNKSYNYWFVQAGVSGLTIPVGPTVTITGFMGGAYHNMTLNTPLAQNALANLPTKTVVAGEGDAPLFTPSETGDGLRAGIRIAIVKDNILKGQAIGTVQWGDDGLQVANLKGDAQLINADGNDDTKGMINGTAELNYDFRENVFHATGSMTADQTLFTLRSSMDVLVDTKRDKYHIYVGTPDDRTTLTVAGIAKLESYFMIGNDIPDIPEPRGIPQDVLYGKLHYKPSRIGGYGMGVGFGASIYMDYRKTILGITPYVKLAAGLDVSIRKADTPTPCAGGRIPGYKGWYAQGNVYAYINGGVDFWGLTSIDVAAGGLLQVGLPNPTWVNGSVFVAFSVGPFDYDADVHIELGDQCQLPSATNEFKFTKPLIAGIDLDEGAQEVSLFKKPVISLNYPLMFDVSEDGENLSHFEIKLAARYTGGGKTTVFKSYNNGLTTGEVLMNTLDNRQQETWGRKDLSMTANTDYTMTVTAQVFKGMQDPKKQHQETSTIPTTAYLVQGKPIVETLSRQFRTERKLAQLDDIVTVQYPFARQKYVLPGEVKTGRISMSRVVNFTDYNDSRFTYDSVPWVQLIDEKTGKTIEAKLTQRGTQFSYSMPALTTNTVYTVRFMLKGKGKPLEFNTSNYVDRNAKPAVPVTKTVTGKSVAVPKEPELADVSTTLYSYRFRTSQYNTFDEKMAALNQGASSSGTGTYSALLRMNPSAESFDRADLVKNDLAEGISIQISPDPDNSRFYREKVKIYDEKLTDSRSNGFWIGEELLRRGFRNQYTAVAKDYDYTDLAETPGGSSDKKGFTVTYSAKGVKDYYDLVADYMSRNFAEARQRKNNGDNIITDATLVTMTWFMSGQNPPTPFPEDQAGLIISYNPDPVQSWQPGPKRRDLVFPITSEKLNAVISTPIKIKP